MEGRIDIVKQRWLPFPAMLVMMLVLVACGGEDTAPEERAQSTADGTRAATMEIAGTTWASAVDATTGEPVDEVESYTTISPAVVLVVEVINVPSGTEFVATWAIDGLDVPEAEMRVTVEDEMAVAWIAFEFVRDEGRYFPLGELEAVVMASSGKTVEATVNIELP